jgi:hypothetical protein
MMTTVKINYDPILNYFDNRNTNASAESFNAKIKAFKNQLRGVRKVDFGSGTKPGDKFCKNEYFCKTNFKI